MVSTTNKSRKDLLLLPTLIGFVFAFRTSLTFLWFQDEPQHGTVVWVALSVILLILASLSSIGGTLSLPTSSFRTPAIRWAAAFLVFALVSLLWSEAPPEAAAGYWVSWAADVATVWFLLRESHPQLQATSLMKGFVWGAGIVAIIAWSIPATDEMRLGDDLFLHPNALGFLFCIATLLAVHLARENSLWRWPALLLATTLLRTLSKSSIIAFCFAFCFYLLRDSTLSRKIKIRIGIAAVAILLSLSSLLEAYFTTYTSGTDPETLTGRTYIWATSLEYALKKPLFGYGFYSYRFIIPPFGKFEAQQAHDELLQQFFSFGAVGVILTIALYWVFFRQVRRAPASHLKTLSATLLLFALLRGLTDTQIFDLSFPLWLITMLSILLSALSQQPQPSEIACLETAAS
jgi:exopolysaccharide production protein ExoQ